MRKIYNRACGMIIVSLAVIIGIVVFSTIIVRSAQKDDSFQDGYYAGLESEYEMTLREYMNERGYINAGIMVTHTVDREGNRVYTVRLHHNRLDRLESAEKEALADEVEELGFRDEICEFRAVFVE